MKSSLQYSAKQKNKGGGPRVDVERLYAGRVPGRRARGRPVPHRSVRSDAPVNPDCFECDSFPDRSVRSGTLKFRDSLINPNCFVRDSFPHRSVRSDALVNPDCFECDSFPHRSVGSGTLKFRVPRPRESRA